MFQKFFIFYWLGSDYRIILIVCNFDILNMLDLTSEKM